MTKSFVLFISVLISQISWGQELNEEAKNIFLDAYCNCFTQNHSEEFEVENFELCLGKELEDDNFESYLDPNSELSENDQGVKLGEKLMFTNLEEIVMKCDSFYNFYIKKTQQSFAATKSELGNENLEEFEAEIISNPNSNAYLKRGFYYLVHENFESAELDLKKSLELDSKNELTKIFLGFLYEQSGNLPEALKWYSEIYEDKKDYQSKMPVVVVKRKIKESTQKQ